MHITSNEQCIPRENHLFVPILHEPADTILCMTGRMQRLDGYLLPNLECLVVFGRCGHGFAIFAADNGE